MSAYRVNSFNANTSRQICRYFANGFCTWGPNCRYLHIEDSSGSHSSNSRNGTHYNNTNGESSSSTLNKSNSNSNHNRYKNTHEEESICKFFLANRCAFGAACWNRHEKPDNDTNETDGQKIDSKNQKDKQKAKEVVEEEFICAICYEIPKTFGLLVQCDHIFCRNCIQEWRKTSNVSSPFQDVDTTKTCPVCRKNSPYIVPSSRYAKSGPQKDEIISSYKEKISRIPCKYFQESGRCPFADACFYQHNNPDGTRCSLGPPTKRKKKSYLSSNFRFMTDSDIDFSISEIIGDLHFNFGWDYDENVNWDDDDDDDDDDEISNYITEHRLTRMTNEEDDDNVHDWGNSDWGNSDWPSNARGWDGWEDFDTDNVGGRNYDFEVLNRDVDWL